MKASNHETIKHPSLSLARDVHIYVYIVPGLANNNGPSQVELQDRL